MFSIGIMGIVKIFSSYIGAALLPTPMVLNAYVMPFYFPGKRLELLRYILSVIVLFSYYIFVYIMSKPASRFVNCFYDGLRKNKLLIAGYLALIIIINLFLLMIPGQGRISLILGIGIWIIVFILPFLLWIWGLCNSWTIKTSKLKNIYYIILGIVILQFITIFVPFITGEPKMINEFLALPEETLINGHYVDNTTFINEHSLWGLVNKSDIVQANSTSKNGMFINIAKSPLIIRFINDGHDTKYYYDDAMQALCINGPMTQSERAELKGIVPEPEQQLVDQLYYSSNSASKSLAKRQYTSEEKSFLSKNLFEIHWQILNRWVLHEHSFLLGPINEYALGRNLQDINIQYGWLNMVVLKNLLQHFGGINYQNYFKLLYSFYYLYYFLLLGLLLILFDRKIGYVLAGAILSFSFLNYIGFDFLFLAPGQNPIRHFLDIFIIFFLFLFVKHKKQIYMYLTLLLSLCSILNSSQEGFYALGALFVTLVARWFIEEYKPAWHEVVLVMLSGIIGLYLFVGLKVGQDQLASYYLNGLLGFPLYRIVLIFFILFSIGYIMIFKVIKSNDQMKYIGLFLLFYTQGMLLYYIWGGTNYHFYNYAPIYVITALVILKLFIDNIDIVKIRESLIIFIVIVLSLLIYVPSLYVYYSAEISYQKIFSTHKTYQWNFDTAKFESTMDPKYFVNAVDLINKYSPNTNGIYIISKYDNIIPFLSKHYSAMPFPELQWFINTDNDEEQCMDAINIAMPEYLYVDTDIEKSLFNDIINSNAETMGNLYNESAWRYGRLNELNMIFQAIKENYQPIENGYLITVYKRIS
jgi:hypothetical protein